MTFEPILSIVVATHNRQQYAQGTLRALSRSIVEKDVEFVVHDSSDVTSLENFVNQLGDSRVIYTHSCAPRNMTENYNAAMAMAKGRYVCMIGDDDGVNPEIVVAARWAVEMELDALTPTRSAVYYWPDFRSRYYGSVHAGKMYIPEFSGSFQMVNPAKGIQLCLDHAGAGIEKWGMVKVYHGLVLRDRILEMRTRTGCFFDGISPDMFGAIAVSHFCRRAAAVEYPLVIPGNGGQSNAGLSALRRHKGTFEQSAHVRNYPKLKWPAGVPRFWAAETAMASAVILGLERLGRSEAVSDFNYILLHAVCAISYPEYWAETRQSFANALRLTNRSGWSGTTQLGRAIMRELLARAVRTGSRLCHPSPSAGADVRAGLNDISEAVVDLGAYLRAKALSFSSMALFPPGESFTAPTSSLPPVHS